VRRMFSTHWTSRPHGRWHTVERETNFLKSLAGRVFVGQRAGMHQLIAALDDVIGGRGRLVILTGSRASTNNHCPGSFRTTRLAKIVRGVSVVKDKAEIRREIGSATGGLTLGHRGVLVAARAICPLDVCFHRQV